MRRQPWTAGFLKAAPLTVAPATAKPWLALFLAIPLLTGCNGQQGPPPDMTAEVAVLTVKTEKVVLTSELPGRTAAYRVAEIRPQVNGLLQKRLFAEGDSVKAGEVLYEIDPAPYKAAYDVAAANLSAARQGADRARANLVASKAGLKRHEAVLKLAKANVERYEKLQASHAVSAMQFDQASTDVDVAEATLRTAEAQVESDREAVEAADAAIEQAAAALETAQINLSYTKITAPISGRIGRSHITEGAIVTAYQPMPLATIQQLDPIFVDVPQSTKELNRLRRSLAAGGMKESGTDSVKIVLEDGTPYPHEGSLKFRDVTVDPTMGSVILRIVVDNPDRVLLPGMFVQAIINEGVNEKAILVPQQAVSRDAKGNPFVLVVDEKSFPRKRDLVIDRAVRNQWLVQSGLAVGDQVIVEGSQKVTLARPGMEPKPVAAVPFGAKSAAPGGSPEKASPAPGPAKPAVKTTPGSSAPDSRASASKTPQPSK